ncbi:hypothetical protein AMJ57_01895 [Parcubacteria bacterium SG8_24]|nr:MAG: hypothetical protein AMJ57_01895 [Parcubacteria bacterium SG8_24]
MVVAVMTLMPQTVRAEESGVESRRKELLWHLAGAPAYFFLSLNFHEGSHALAGMALGYEVEAYKPYPHFAKLDDGSEQFVGGAVHLKDPIDSAHLAFISIAPMLTDILVFTAADLSLSYIETDSHAVPFILNAGMLYVWADFVGGLISIFFDHGDLKRFGDESGVPPALTFGVGCALAYVGFVRILDRQKQFILGTRDDATSGRAMIAPLYHRGEAIGLSYSFRF